MYKTLKLKIQCLLLIICVLTPLLLFSGCYDLGDFQDINDYYSTFNVATFISQDLTQKQYSTEEYLYNKETVEKNNCFIVEDEYIYIAIRSLRDLNICAMSLGVCATVEKKLNSTLFICDYVEEFINFELVIKNHLEINPLDYGNIDESMFVPVGIKVTSNTVSLSPNKWGSVYIDSFDVKIKKDQYIVLRFDNNSGFNCGRDQNVALKINNLLLRAKF